jgi:hypothetical protein
MIVVSLVGLNYLRGGKNVRNNKIYVSRGGVIFQETVLSHTLSHHQQNMLYRMDLHL